MDKNERVRALGAMKKAIQVIEEMDDLAEEIQAGEEAKAAPAKKEKVVLKVPKDILKKMETLKKAQSALKKEIAALTTNSLSLIEETEDAWQELRERLGIETFDGLDCEIDPIEGTLVMTPCGHEECGHGH